MNWRHNKIWLRSTYYIVPLLVFLVIWVPVIDHYYVPHIDIADEMIETARRFPADSVLDEINGKKFNYLLNKSWRSEKSLIAAAENILDGNIEIPGLPSMRISMPFNANDINQGLPAWQLHLAGFTLPEVLISAYEVTGREDFLEAARDMILAWDAYERSIWLPKGLIWNDHAIVARTVVVSKFWKLYRNHSDYQPDVATAILHLVLRSGQLLATSSHFTFATNHGIMQNLGLWHLCLAFPTLPGIEEYKLLALHRMRDQMNFYLHDEGVILEHSAGYQRIGLQFLGMAFRYLALMDISIPDTWKGKYEKAKDFYAQLRRPDGSLPAFGDTGGGKDPLGPPVTYVNGNGQKEVLDFKKNWMPKQSLSLYPVAGYSIWWDGLDEWPDPKELNQTVVVWSNFPGQAHKHADEMSVILYASGQTWWTNAGYWTYGTKGRSEAVSWSGSNAPHLVGERVDSLRYTTLKFHGSSDKLAVIDIERRGSNEYIARRQVVHLKPNLWIVVDNTSGDENSRTRTIWTTPSDVTLKDGKFPDSYYLQNDDKNLSLESFLITSDKTRIDHYQGSLEPFAGWVQNEPADALVLEQPANNSSSVVIWSFGNADHSAPQFTGKPYMKNGVSPESWEIVLPLRKDPLRIWRDGNSIYLNEGSDTESIHEVILNAPDDIPLKYAEIRAAYEKTADKYPRFRDLLYYRWRITYFLICLFIVQEILFYLYKMREGRHYNGLRSFAMIGWLSVVVIWQMTLYLKN